MITSLDWHAQSLAEKWLTAGAIIPNLPSKKAATLMKELKIPTGDPGVIRDIDTPADLLPPIRT